MASRTAAARTTEEAEAAEDRLKRPVAHDARITPFGVDATATAVRTRHASPRVPAAVVEGRPYVQSDTFFASPGRTVGTLAKWRSVLSPQVTRDLFALAWPIATAMLGETALGLVDTKLVGGLGAAALGGVGLATTLMYLCYSLTFGGMRGVKVRVAHAVGEGNAHHGFGYARAGLLMGFAVGAVILVLCRDVSPVLVALGADAAIVPYARDFLAAVTLGAPATCALSALIQHRQGMGDSRTPMVAGIAGNAFNAVLAWGLIYGRFGLPALGVRGGGYATALTENLELAALLVCLVRDERRAFAKLPAGTAPLSLGTAARGVAELGLPTGLQFMAEMLAFTAFTVILGSISKEEIAAHQIALNVIRVSFLPGVAIAEATSVLVGKALGGRRVHDADAAVTSGLALAVGFMALCGVFFAIGGGLTARFFSSDPLVIHGAQTLLFVAAVFQVLDAVNIVLRGALRGAKDVRVVALIGISVVWTFLPTSAYLVGKLCGLGALGGWFGFVGETTIGALLFWNRWKHGGWRKAYALG